MKKQIFLMATLLAILVSLSCYGQAQPTTRRTTREFTFDTKGKAYEINRGEIVTVVIRNVGDSGVVVLNPASNDGGALVVKAWGLHYNSGVKSLMMNSITALPDRPVTFNNQRLLVDGNWSVNKRIVVHITLPPTALVHLSVDGKVLRNGPVRTGLIARGNEMVEGGKGGLGTSEKIAITQAMIVGNVMGKTPPLDPEAVLPPAKVGGEYTLLWKVLKGYAVTSITPDNSLAQKRGAQAFVVIFVDRNGLVTRAEHRSGDEELGRPTAQILRQWRFNPYKVEGQTVNVRSSILVRIAADGKVIL